MSEIQRSRTIEFPYAGQQIILQRMGARLQSRRGALWSKFLDQYQQLERAKIAFEADKESTQTQQELQTAAKSSIPQDEELQIMEGDLEAASMSIDGIGCTASDLDQCWNPEEIGAIWLAWVIRSRMEPLEKKP